MTVQIILILSLLFSFSFSFSLHAEKSFVVYFSDTPQDGKVNALSTNLEREIFEVDEKNVEEFLHDMKSDKRVVIVEENKMFRHFWEPGQDDPLKVDTFYSQQWSLEASARGIQMPDAWDISRGNSNIVVAVLDTGIINWDDFENILPGADLISRHDIANDGGGRDLDPTDPGDWFYPREFSGCPEEFSESSWHGTHVAGIVAAKANNGKGIVGVAPNVSILPVRVLGKCGGMMTDIADGIIWASGGKVAGLPINNNPAHIINMSLGAKGICEETTQRAIDFARARGSVIVVSAGNSKKNMDYTPFSPATCRGVISTGSSDQFAERSHFSNYGSQVDVVAPGGTGRFGLGIKSLSNAGRKEATDNIVESYNGTSMAAPHVSGAAALILSLNPGLYPYQVEHILRETAEGIVGMGTGKGMINVFEALKMAEVTDPDPHFKVKEVIIERKPSSSYIESDSRFVSRTGDQDGGGSCGTIDTNQSGGPGGGGKASFLLTLMLGVMLSRSFKYRFS